MKTAMFAVLACAVLAAPAAAQIVVNEVDYDQPGADAAEYVEIKNAGSSPVDLSLYSLRLVNGGVTPPAAYATIALPAVNLAAGDYFVVCANAANTPNCDLDHTTNTDMVQNGAPDAVAIILNSDSSIVDVVSYEGNTTGWTEGSGVGLVDDGAVVARGISRFPDGADTNQNNVDLSARCNTPGTPNLSASSGCAVGSATAEIYEIQGSGMTSPLRNLSVTTRNNVVTALDASGFFMQTPDERADADPQTSNGVFVFTGGSHVGKIEVGNLVDLTASVDEFFEQTEMENPVNMVVVGQAASLPQAVRLDSFTPSPVQPQPANEMERYEGMRVEVLRGTATGPTDQFGDTPMVAYPGRTFREPGILFPGLPGLPVWDGNPELFEVDPNALLLRDRVITAGSRIVTEGVLGFAFGDYQVFPTALRITPVGLPRPVRPAGAGEMALATQNLHVFVDTIDDPGTDEDVVNAVQYNAKLNKLSRYIRQVLNSPQVLVVQEAEKLSVLQDLAHRISLDDPAVRYTAHLMEGNDIGGIDVGVMVRDGIHVHSVEQFGKDDTFVYNGQTFILHDRPPLVVELEQHELELTLTVIAVHNRSLGGIDGSDGGRIREKRHQQALRLSQHIQTLQQADPSVKIVVAGDFNAFQFTDGYVDVMGQLTGNPDPAGALIPATDEIDPDLTNQVLSLPESERYSFVFDGSAQVLDHILTSQALLPHVLAVQFARGNADAAAAWESDSSSILRAADHDGLVMFLGAKPAAPAGGPATAPRGQEGREPARRQ